MSDLNAGFSDEAATGRVDLARAEAAVRELLIAVGEDPDREGLLQTPARVARWRRSAPADNFPSVC